jgi:fumarate reductase subunit D
MMRVAVIIPVVLLVLFTGLLWLLGLMCGRERRRYVTDFSRQAMTAIGVLLHGSPAPPAHNRAEDP